MSICLYDGYSSRTTTTNSQRLWLTLLIDRINYDHHPHLQELDLLWDTRPTLSVLYLANITVWHAHRRQGIGTSVMLDLCHHCDKRDVLVWLSLADKNRETGTTSRERLRRFYRRFGFVSNRGRYKDFSLSMYASMYRVSRTVKSKECKS